MPRLLVDGAELYFEDTGGAGPAIVFSHGLLWDARMYAAQVAHLRDRFRCVAYDHRAQGRSTGGAHDLDRLTADAIALIEHLRIAPCHFVGLSMGGFVGLRIAARRPELLRKLVLIDTAADGEPRWNVPRYRAMGSITRLFGLRPLLRPIMKIMFARSFLRDPARAADRREMERRLLALDPHRMRHSLEAVVTRPPIEDLLPGIRVPTLVVWGEEDAAIVRPRARAVVEQLPGAEWIEIPRAGHTSTVENPAAINAALDRFLTR